MYRSPRLGSSDRLKLCKEGWIFDEVVRKKKELFRILNLPVPSSEQIVKMEDSQEEYDELEGIDPIVSALEESDQIDL